MTPKGSICRGNARGTDPDHEAAATKIDPRRLVRRRTRYQRHGEDKPDGRQAEARPPWSSWISPGP